MAEAMPLSKAALERTSRAATPYSNPNFLSVRLQGIHWCIGPLPIRISFRSLVATAAKPLEEPERVHIYTDAVPPRRILAAGPLSHRSRRVPRANCTPLSRRHDGAVLCGGQPRQVAP